jgi:hypothetical protein
VHSDGLIFIPFWEASTRRHPSMLHSNLWLAPLHNFDGKSETESERSKSFDESSRTFNTQITLKLVKDAKIN